MSKVKVAFQYYGELRYWDKIKTNISNYKKYIKNLDFTIDFYLCTWENEHTKKILSNREFEIFKDVKLIKSPSRGKKIGKPKKGSTENREGESVGIYNASYSMFYASYFRQKYQSKNNIKYDWVLSSRPDMLINKEKFYIFNDQIINKQALWIHEGEIPNDYTLFYSDFKRQLNSKFIGYLNQNDNYMLGTEESINLYCRNFHLNFLFQNNYIPTYHSYVGHTIINYNLVVRTDDIGFNKNFQKLGNG